MTLIDRPLETADYKAQGKTTKLHLISASFVACVVLGGAWICQADLTLTY
jgi:hypothetical protein